MTSNNNTCCDFTSGVCGTCTNEEVKQLQVSFNIKAYGDDEEDKYKFSGYANTFNHKDRVGDITMPGAFTKSLLDHAKAGTKPVMLYQHDHTRPIGVWEKIVEDQNGLYVEGKLTQGVKDADEAYRLLKDGAINSMSIGYATVKEHYDRDEKANMLEEVKLFEISLVSIPANEQSLVIDVKSDPEAKQHNKTSQDGEACLNSKENIMTEEVKNDVEIVETPEVEAVEPVAEEAVEEVVETEEVVEETVEEVVAEEVAVEETVEEVAEEAVEEVVAEEVAVEETVEEVVVEDDADEKSAPVEIETKDAAIADLEEKSAKADEQIKNLTEELEALQAKAARPSIKTFKNKEKSIMENKEMMDVFARKGLDALKEKGGDLQISTDAQGGFALPVEMANDILMLQNEKSPMRQVAGALTTQSTDYSQLVSIGNAASGWVGETDARSKTDAPELTKISAVFGEIYAAPKAFQHVLEDAFFNVEAWLNGEVAREFNEKEGDAFLNGNGVNKPVGILNGQDVSAAYTAGDATRDFGKFQTVLTGAAATLGATSDDVINNLRNVVLSMKTGYLPGAKFMMNRATHNILVDLKNADGEYFLQRDIANAAGDKLFGYDIVVNEDMADVAAGNFPIIFGDFDAAYKIIDRVGVSVLRDPYSAYGAVSFYTRKRVGSMILNTEALKVVGIGA